MFTASDIVAMGKILYGTKTYKAIFIVDHDTQEIKFFANIFNRKCYCKTDRESALKHLLRKMFLR